MNHSQVLYSLIDRIFDYLETETLIIKPLTQSKRRDRLSLWDFDGAEVFVDESLDLESRQDIGYFPDVHPRDLTRPLNVAMVGSPIESDKERTLLTFQRYRQVSVNAVRGLKVHSPYYCRTQHGLAKSQRRVRNQSRISRMAQTDGLATSDWKSGPISG